MVPFTGSFWPAKGRSWPVSDQCRRPTRSSLDLGLFRHFKSLINLNPKISHCTFKFGVPEQQLYSPRADRGAAARLGIHAAVWKNAHYQST
jgi:hypothetical protein